MPSTAINDVEYEPDRECLTVTFVTGRIYEYFDVPPDEAAAFQSASSKGTYFNQHIRDRYRFHEITASPD
jgi:lysyl-tRNA synthetase class 2